MSLTYGNFERIVHNSKIFANYVGRNKLNLLAIFILQSAVNEDSKVWSQIENLEKSTLSDFRCGRRPLYDDIVRAFLHEKHEVLLSKIKEYFLRDDSISDNISYPDLIETLLKEIDSDTSISLEQKNTFKNHAERAKKENSKESIVEFLSSLLIYVIISNNNIVKKSTAHSKYGYAICDICDIGKLINKKISPADIEQKLEEIAIDTMEGLEGKYNINANNKNRAKRQFT